MNPRNQPKTVLEKLRGGLIVSCQAGPDSPLYDVRHITALAKSAERGGAVGFRIDGPDNVAAVRRQTGLPILGIRKREEPGAEVYITPAFPDAKLIIEAGCDLLALDGTDRPRPGGASLATIIGQVHDQYNLPVMADIASLDDARYAVKAGADLVGTTLAGYTDYSRDSRDANRPAVELAATIAAEVEAPVVVEGGIWTPEHVTACFAAGAFAVVVGSAVTVPEFITRRLNAATPRGRGA